MSLRTTLPLLTVAAALLASACQRPAKPPTEVPPSPEIASFTASAPSVAAGTEVTLSWKVTNASSVSVLDANAGPIAAVATDAFESSTKVTLTQSTVFILTARGEAGSDTRLVNVQVEGSRAAVLFRAVPDEIEGGQSATLIWSAPEASSVTITDDAGGVVDLGGQTNGGSIAVSPSKTTVYSLAAGSSTLTVTVEVRPAVLEFNVSPPAAAPGDSVTLSWRTSGASKVVLSSLGRGALETVTTGAELATGSFTDTVPARR